MVIKQEGSFFKLDVRCESNGMNRSVIREVFDRYNEADGVIITGYTATNIVKLVSLQMILITELSENGQI